MWAKLIFF